MSFVIDQLGARGHVIWRQLRVVDEAQQLLAQGRPVMQLGALPEGAVCFKTVVANINSAAERINACQQPACCKLALSQISGKAHVISTRSIA